MRFIWHYLKKYKKLGIINVISVFGFALVELGIPTIVALMIDNVVMNNDAGYDYDIHHRSVRNNFTRVLLRKNLHLYYT